MFQEICLLHRFLTSKGGQGKDYANFTQEALVVENENLKSILSKTAPQNEDLVQSLSFYRIQYHLLKKKFANISVVTQQKNVRALEESLALAQKQLVESEAYQHYNALGSPDKIQNILLEEICECKLEIRHLHDKIEDLSSSNTKMRKKIDLSKEVLNNYEKTIERLHRQLEYFKVKHTIPEIGHLQRQMWVFLDSIFIGLSKVIEVRLISQEYSR